MIPRLWWQKPRLPTRWADSAGRTCSPAPRKIGGFTPASTQFSNCSLTFIFSAGSGYCSMHLTDTTFILESRHQISSFLTWMSVGNEAAKLGWARWTHVHRLTALVAVAGSGQSVHCCSVTHTLSRRHRMVEDACFRLCLGLNLLGPGFMDNHLGTAGRQSEP